MGAPVSSAAAARGLLGSDPSLQLEVVHRRRIGLEDPRGERAEEGAEDAACTAAGDLRTVGDPDLFRFLLGSERRHERPNDRRRGSKYQIKCVFVH